KVLEVATHPARGYAYIYACQLSAASLPKNPRAFLRLGEELLRAAAALPEDVLPPAPPFVSRPQLSAEALLLISQAQNLLGDARAARASAQQARAALQASFDTEFLGAICDYFEGSAASFAGEFEAAERLLESAGTTFREFGQTNWEGRALAALGTLVAQQERDGEALALFDRARSLLDRILDAGPYVMTLINEALSLVFLGRLDDARATYAEALQLALRLGSPVQLHAIRNGLAIIEMRRGRFEKALSAFEKQAVRARGLGFVEDLLYAELHVAECLATLGRETLVESALSRLNELLAGQPGRFIDAPELQELSTLRVDSSPEALDALRRVRLTFERRYLGRIVAPA
ncbi:MAG: hypothetical protein ABIQ65_12495, partial [Thermoanaerobaculia bacterium]